MSEIRRYLRAGTALAAAALALVACGGGGSGGGQSGGSKQFVVGYSQSNNAEAYRAQLNVQLQYFVKRYPDLKLLPISDAHKDSTTQVSQVQSFVNQHVDVLIVSPNEPAPLTAPIEQACAQHIPVIVLDRSVNTDCYSSFIGGDNVAIGRKAGEEAVKLLPGGGNVVEIQGLLSDQPQIDRDKGFRDAIASNPSIKVLDQRDAGWTRPQAETIMQQWLQRFPKIDLVYSQNDDMAIGAYLTAAAVNRQDRMKFIGIDGLAIPDGGIRAVQQGHLAATFIYPTCAQEAADTAEKVVHHQSVQKKQTLSTTQVTKDNAAQLYAKYDFSNKH
jgi:ribose transport system substrate-binding protein